MAVREPMVSNISTKRKATTAFQKPRLAMAERSIFMKVEWGWGRDKRPLGALAWPVITARRVTATMPMKMAPFTSRAMRTPVMMRPTDARMAGGLARFPRVTRVAGDPLMKPASLMPMKAMKRPMPTGVAFLMDSGMASTSLALRPRRVRRMKRIPSTNTAPRAICQE